MSTTEHYINALNERFTTFKRALRECIALIASEHKDLKAKSVQSLDITLRDLSSLIAEVDHPPWIGTLRTAIVNFNQSPGHAESPHRLLKTIISVMPYIESQVWDFTTQDDAIDFAKVFEEYSSQSKLEKCFESTVDWLEQLIRADVLDSVRVLRSLENLIATLKKNAKSDLNSKATAWNIATMFICNTVKSVVKDAPGVKHIVEGLEETMRQTNIEFADVYSKINTKLVLLLKQKQPALTSNEQFIKPSLIEDSSQNNDVVDSELVDSKDETN